jgi:septal ring factor EnvC (AmiA/AmiB activator)
MFEPADPLEPLKLLANMVAVFADPERAERQIKKFQDAKAASDRAKASLVEARAKHDQHIADSNAELDRSRAGFRKLERELEEREGRLAVREERLREREQADMRRTGRLEVVGFGGLSREREPFTEADDPHFGSAA